MSTRVVAENVYEVLGVRMLDHPILHVFYISEGFLLLLLKDLFHVYVKYLGAGGVFGTSNRRVVSGRLFINVKEMMPV